MAVSFASATNRRFWQSAFLSSALQISIAVVIGFYFGRSAGDNPWVIAGVVYLGFLAVSFFWWSTRHIVAWLIWGVLWRRAAINDLVASFQKARLPPPDHFHGSATSYFEEVVGNEALDLPVRMAAAAHYLRVSEFAPQQGIIVGVRTSRLYEDAIAAFRSTFPAEAS